MSKNRHIKHIASHYISFFNLCQDPLNGDSDTTGGGLSESGSEAPESPKDPWASLGGDGGCWKDACLGCRSRL